MEKPLDYLVGHLVLRVGQVQRSLGRKQGGLAGAENLLGELLDSMGLVEFLAVIANDLGTTVETLEQAAHFRFGTIGALAADLIAAGFSSLPPVPIPPIDPFLPSGATACGQVNSQGWLMPPIVRLPEYGQSAEEINKALGRPAGWLESHAGIDRRGLWRKQDPLDSATDAGREGLVRAGLSPDRLGLLLVTSEAPPLLTGLAAALHHRLHLPTTTPALEIGGACTGFLAALGLATQILSQVKTVLAIAVEAPSRHLALEPGPEGEAAALFGDGAAACLLGDQPFGPDALPIQRISLHTDGSRGDLIRVDRNQEGHLKLRLKGQPLALHALRAMAQAVRDIIQYKEWSLSDLGAVVCHGGNGRMAGMLARELGLPPAMVWSNTPHTGNLGSASLPAAWAVRSAPQRGPEVWTAVGAGLTWGAMLLGTK